MTRSATARPAEIVGAAYEAFARLDLEALLALVDDDAVLTQDDALPWGGRYEGRDGVVLFLTSLVGTIESTVTPEALFEAGQQVVQYGRTRGTVRSSGRAFDVPECHVWTVRDGRIIDVRFFIDSAAMLDALDQPRTDAAMHSG
jgi:ketosteroid isomerase-like protein